MCHEKLTMAVEHIHVTQHMKVLFPGASTNAVYLDCLVSDSVLT